MQTSPAVLSVVHGHRRSQVVHWVHVLPRADKKKSAPQTNPGYAYVHGNTETTGLETARRERAGKVTYKTDPAENCS